MYHTYKRASKEWKMIGIA